MHVHIEAFRELADFHNQSWINMRAQPLDMPLVGAAKGTTTGPGRQHLPGEYGLQ